jgi:hypothetical protein
VLLDADKLGRSGNAIDLYETQPCLIGEDAISGLSHEQKLSLKLRQVSKLMVAVIPEFSKLRIGVMKSSIQNSDSHLEVALSFTRDSAEDVRRSESLEEPNADGSGTIVWPQRGQIVPCITTRRLVSATQPFLDD